MNILHKDKKGQPTLWHVGCRMIMQDLPSFVVSDLVFSFFFSSSSSLKMLPLCPFLNPFLFCLPVLVP